MYLAEYLPFLFTIMKSDFYFVSQNKQKSEWFRAEWNTCNETLSSRSIKNMDYNSGKGNFLEILLKYYFHHFFKVWKILMHKNAIKKK